MIQQRHPARLCMFPYSTFRWARQGGTYSSGAIKESPLCFGSGGGRRGWVFKRDLTKRQQKKTLHLVYQGTSPILAPEWRLLNTFLDEGIESALSEKKKKKFPFIILKKKKSTGSYCMFCLLNARTHAHVNIHFTCCRRKTHFQRDNKKTLTKEERKANAVLHRAGETALTLHENNCEGKERSFGHEDVWRTEGPNRVTGTKNEVETKISLFFPSRFLSFFFLSGGRVSVHVRFLDTALLKGHRKICVKAEHKQVKHQTARRLSVILGNSAFSEWPGTFSIANWTLCTSKKADGMRKCAFVCTTKCLPVIHKTRSLNTLCALTWQHFKACQAGELSQDTANAAKHIVPLQTSLIHH